MIIATTTIAATIPPATAPIGSEPLEPPRSAVPLGSLVLVVARRNTNKH